MQPVTSDTSRSVLVPPAKITIFIISNHSSPDCWFIANYKNICVYYTYSLLYIFHNICTKISVCAAFQENMCWNFAKETNNGLNNSAVFFCCAFPQDSKPLLVTVHAPSNFGTILCIEHVNSNLFAHKMRKSTHFGTRFPLCYWTSKQQTLIVLILHAFYPQVKLLK